VTDYSAIFNTKSKDVLSRALYFEAHYSLGDVPKALAIIKAGADINYKGFSGDTVLMGAALHGHTELLKALLERGALVNEKNSGGNTALIMAAAAGKMESVTLLLEYGADRDAKNNYGNGALFCAAFAGRVGALKALIEKGVNIHQRDKEDDFTVLMHYASRGSEEGVQVLLAAGADPNLVDDDGQTALMFAAWGGHIETAKVLVAGGALVDVADKNGSTASDIARSRGREDFVSYISALRLERAQDKISRGLEASMTVRALKRKPKLP
jgi:ankyrin repeat protein